MRRARFKILFVRSGRAVPRPLSRVLAKAGYGISGAKRVSGPKLAGERFDAVVAAGVTFTELVRSLNREAARSPAGRSSLFTAELAPLEARPRARAQGPRRPKRTSLTPITLQALREKIGMTQGEIATRVSMTQPQLSRVEARRDHLMSTVRKYVRALEGRVEVAAILDGSRIVLRDV